MERSTTTPIAIHTVLVVVPIGTSLIIDQLQLGSKFIVEGEMRNVQPFFGLTLIADAPTRRNDVICPIIAAEHPVSLLSGVHVRDVVSDLLKAREQLQ